MVRNRLRASLVLALCTAFVGRGSGIFVVGSLAHVEFSSIVKNASASMRYAARMR